MTDRMFETECGVNLYCNLVCAVCVDLAEEVNDIISAIPQTKMCLFDLSPAPSY